MHSRIADLSRHPDSEGDSDILYFVLLVGGLGKGGGVQAGGEFRFLLKIEGLIQGETAQRRGGGGRHRSRDGVCGEVWGAKYLGGGGGPTFLPDYAQEFAKTFQPENPNPPMTKDLHVPPFLPTCGPPSLRGPTLRDIVIPSLPSCDAFSGRFSHRHICAMPHFETRRETIV